MSYGNPQNIEASIPLNVKMVGAKGNGVTDDTAAIQAALNSGANTVYIPAGNYIVSSPIMINSYTKVYGDGMKTTVIKNNNTTVTLTDPSSGLSYTSNSCFYVNPAYVTNSDHSSGVDAATQIEVSRLRVRFTATFSADSCAVFTTQLGRAKFDELYVAGCDWSIYAITLYTTSVNRVFGRGVRIDKAGTSLNFTSCGGGGATGNTYVWKFNNVVYSTMSGCSAEDRTSGYRFDNCTMTLDSIGSEQTTSSSAIGCFIDFGINNNIELTNPSVFVKSSSATGPIISVNAGNQIRVTGGNFNKNAGQSGVYDLWLQAWSSNIVFDNTVFYNGTTSGLSAQCNSAMGRTGSPAWVISGGQITKYTPNSATTPLLQSVVDSLNTSTANEIHVDLTTGGGAYDSLIQKMKADASDCLSLTKRGSLSSGTFASAAGGAELVLSGGTGDLAIGTIGTGKVRIGANGNSSVARLIVEYHTYPGGDQVYDLGKPTARWQNGFINILASTPVAVANLPTAIGRSGYRMFVSDSTVDATSAAFGATVAGGGTYTVPVYSNGLTWRIG